MSKVRKQSVHLLATYVARRTSGSYGARVVDGRTDRERRCTRGAPVEAALCAREKMLEKPRRK
jgi:hypothetical protein